jgi:hypothetical protein
VGFGDAGNIPTTSNGKMVAVVCMVWSLVILALPVGVIGGTFSRVWHEFAENKSLEIASLRREMVFVASAVQRMQPHKVSCLVRLEVWGDDGSDESCMPQNAEGFMGEAKLGMELSQDWRAQYASKSMHLIPRICNHELDAYSRRCLGAKFQTQVESQPP